jgi:hypothetical protein
MLSEVCRRDIKWDASPVPRNVCRARRSVRNGASLSASAPAPEGAARQRNDRHERLRHPHWRERSPRRGGDAQACGRVRVSAWRFHEVHPHAPPQRPHRATPEPRPARNNPDLRSQERPPAPGLPAETMQPRREARGNERVSLHRGRGVPRRALRAPSDGSKAATAGSAPH